MYNLLIKQDKGVLRQMCMHLFRGAYFLIGGNMLKINEDYLKLRGSYLFSDIAKKVKAFGEANPDKKIISTTA